MYAECSNHGQCHRYYGQCQCESGFKGVACQDISDSGDLNTTTHYGQFFTGSMMKLQLYRNTKYDSILSSKDFHFMSIKKNDESVIVLHQK